MVRFFLRLTIYGLQFTAILFLASCAPHHLSKSESKGYRSIAEKWTREVKVYENFETKLIIAATYKNEEFRDAYIDEYSKIYMLDADRKERLERAERDAPKKYHEFFLSMHTPNIEWSDLEKKEPLWALYLVNDAGDTVSPLEIKKVKDKGPGLTRFYPHVTDWGVVYSVKFPLNKPDGRTLLSPETKYLKLIMTGAPGRGELIWNLN